MNELNGIHHIAITVSDLERSVAWYASVLGFAELFREGNDESQACVMRYPGSLFGIGLVEHARDDGSPFDPTRRGLDHAAFTVASREALDEWADRLTAGGVTHSGAMTCRQTRKAS